MTESEREDARIALKHFRDSYEAGLPNALRALGCATGIWQTGEPPKDGKNFLADCGGRICIMSWNLTGKYWCSHSQHC